MEWNLELTLKVFFFHIWNFFSERVRVLQRTPNQIMAEQLHPPPQPTFWSVPIQFCPQCNEQV